MVEGEVVSTRDNAVVVMEIVLVHTCLQFEPITQ